MLKYLEFITENEDTTNNRENKRITSFKDFNNPNFKFIRSLFGDEKVDEQEVMKKYEEFLKFKKEADYLQNAQKYIYLFFKLKEEGRVSDQDLMDLYKEIQSHSNTMKQYEIELLHFSKLEEVTDELAKVKLIERTNKFVKLLPNNLRTAIKKDITALQKFKSMLIGYSYEDYKNVFRKKIITYKSLDQLFDALDAHLRTFLPKAEIFKAAEEHPGAQVIYSTDDYLVVRIYSEKASQDLGSAQWCISYLVNSYWDNYISKEDGYDNGVRPGAQYFIWDFDYSPADIQSLVGVTIYMGGENKAHGKDDTSISYRHKKWAKHLKAFGSFTDDEKIRLIADNPIIEKYTGFISKLGEKQKRKLLQEVPKLLLHFDDLSFLNNQEIWSLVKRDIGLAVHIKVAEQLTDDQLIHLVIKNPNLLEEKWDNNPYKSITSKLDRSQRVEMISNKHSLYEQFDDLTEDEKFDLIKLDPRIMVSYINIPKEVNADRLAETYLANKSHWDNVIGSCDGERKTIIQLLFTHLMKTKERVNMEDINHCYIIVAKVLEQKDEDGNNYLIIDENKVIYVENILSPQNQKISTAMLMASFNDDLDGFNGWVPMGLLPLDELIEDEYHFKSSMESLIEGTAEDKKEQAIYNSLIKTKVFLSELDSM